MRRYTVCLMTKSCNFSHKVYCDCSIARVLTGLGKSVCPRDEIFEHIHVEFNRVKKVQKNLDFSHAEFSQLCAPALTSWCLWFLKIHEMFGTSYAYLNGRLVTGNSYSHYYRCTALFWNKSYWSIISELVTLKSYTFEIKCRLFGSS